MNVTLSEEQIRYVMAKIEADVVSGNTLADSVERELDLCLMDEEQRARERFQRAAAAHEADLLASAERWSSQFRNRY